MLSTIVSYLCAYLITIWSVIFFVGAPTYFSIMLLDISKENGAAQIIFFVQEHRGLGGSIISR